MKRARKRLEQAGKGSTPAPTSSTAAAGDSHRQRMNEKSRTESKAVREIGPLPPIRNPDRRAACRADLLLACTTYFPGRFFDPFCDDQIRVIQELQRVIVFGGQKAYGMPRGFGKTQYAETGAIWGILNGYRRFGVLIGATDGLADEMLVSIKNEFETNELLMEDFPEVCYPIARLEGIARRGRGQTLNGIRTQVEWAGGEIRLPVIRGSLSAGAYIATRGLTGAIRGLKKSGLNGAQWRPDFVICDDPQTDESSKSIEMNNQRERIINGAVLGLAGKKKVIAAMMPCTIIRPNDMADRLLDRQRNPAWSGERTKTLYKFPTDTAWWDRYAEVRRESLRVYGDNRLGNELYEREREQADAGAEVAWVAAYDPEVNRSALQEAMNFYIDRPEAFAAEAQNNPLTLLDPNAAEPLNADAIAARLTRVPRATIPRDCTRVTAFIDVSESVLWFVVTAWDEKFGGSVIDYGCHPAQNRSYFRQNDARPSLRDVYPGLPIEAVVFAGLRDLAAALIPRNWSTEAGHTMRIEKALVDAGDMTDTIHSFVRQSTFAGVLIASKGFGIGASGRPMEEWTLKPHERRGDNWLMGVPESGKGRLVKFGSNEWKTFAADRLRTPDGAPGCLKLFGTEPHIHQLFADQMTAEIPIRNSGRGRDLTIWTEIPGRDNHFFDGIVGTAVAASVSGLRWSASAAAGLPFEPPKKRKKLDIEEAYRLARQKEAAEGRR